MLCIQGFGVLKQFFAQALKKFYKCNNDFLIELVLDFLN